MNLSTQSTKYHLIQFANMDLLILVLLLVDDAGVVVIVVVVAVFVVLMLVAVATFLYYLTSAVLFKISQVNVKLTHSNENNEK